MREASALAGSRGAPSGCAHRPGLAPPPPHTLLLLRSVVGAGRADRVPRGTLCPAPLVPFPHRAARRVRPARDSPGPRSSPTAPPAQSEGAPRERGGAGGEGKAKQRPRHWRVRLSSALVRNTHTHNPKTTAARRLQGDPGFPVSKPAGALPPARRTSPPEHPHEGRRTCPLVLGGPGRARGAGRACPPGRSGRRRALADDGKARCESARSTN